ncbi:MAG: hypothetical protein ACRD1Z_08660 [Vicinamibacteria bacterium]
MLPLLAVLALQSLSGGEILEARLQAALDGGPDVVVRLAYRIEAPGADRVAFSALEIEGVAIEELSAFASETRLPLSVEPRSGPKLVGSIGIPKPTSALELRYVVRGGAVPTENGLRVRLPCAILDLKIEQTRTGLFSFAIELPDGLSVVDGFPSHFVAGVDGSTRWELPLVPTFVAFRASSATALLTPTRLATIAVVVLLMTMGFVGVRRARASRA